tara:strand:- start:438 stop:596 length:159 start_codon:yes stop_codon:yes gene_type:complete
LDKKSKEKCPYCENTLEFEKNGEDDGDRYYDIWVCTNKKCNQIVFPFYFKYA